MPPALHFPKLKLTFNARGHRTVRRRLDPRPWAHTCVRSRGRAWRGPEGSVGGVGGAEPPTAGAALFLSIKMYPWFWAHSHPLRRARPARGRLACPGEGSVRRQNVWGATGAEGAAGATEPRREPPLRGQAGSSHPRPPCPWGITARLEGAAPRRGARGRCSACASWRLGTCFRVGDDRRVLSKPWRCSCRAPVSGQ